MLKQIVVSAEDWPSWLAEECRTRHWSHSWGSPLVWRELVDTGGKGLYMGGLKEFEDYANHYYNICPSTDHVLEEKIAIENLKIYEDQQHCLKEKQLSEEPPVKVCLTNSSCVLAYHLSQLVASGAVVGAQQKVAIHLYDESISTQCEALSMELQDLASPLVKYVKVTASLQEAFDSISLVFLLDYSYCNENLKLTSSADVDEEMLASAALIYQKYAQTLDYVANKDVKVVVSGCFANTGVGVMADCVSSLSPSAFIADPCLAESQAKAVLANKLKLNSSDISKVAVWGRTHGQVLADITFTRVAHFLGAVVGPDPFTLPLLRCEFDREWLKEEFPKLVAARHSKLEGYREEGPAMVEAIGLAKVGSDWRSGENKEEWHSVGVVSDGTAYDIPKGVVAAIPCQCVEGKWKPVLDLELSQPVKVSNYNYTTTTFIIYSCRMS